MSIDFSKYSSATTRPQERSWSPPISELSMKERSAKLAISTRCYPEYLLAAFAFLESEYRLQASSLSELVYLIICDYINQNQNKIGSVPSPEVALEFFISRGFISVNNKENQKAFSDIHLLSSRNEERMLSNPSLAEQAKYWKDRDPEKYEAIMQEFEKEVIAGLMKEPPTEQPAPPKPQEPEEPETISTTHKSFEELLEEQRKKEKKPELAGQINLDDIPTVKEDE